MACTCFIVPNDVLERLAADKELSNEIRQGLNYTAAVSDRMRRVRQAHAELTLTDMQMNFAAAIIAPPVLTHQLPAVDVYDGKQRMTLPGTAIGNPGASADGSCKRAYDTTKSVAQFYWDVFKRDSLDSHHMTLLSTVHYGNKFDNAFWNGSQMVYGDGDGTTFADFTLGNDVIGHELTHGVTQHSLALSYTNEAGGLNESLSDVFGSMFRQWQAGQDVNSADWLIGHEIIGPAAKTKGYTCLRDMSNPAAGHCLAPQPTKYSQYHAGMDPHYSSGIPNFAFYKAAKAVGGSSWAKVGQVWYKVLTTTPPTPNMTMKQFANLTRGLSTADATLHGAIDAAWIAVGL